MLALGTRLTLGEQGLERGYIDDVLIPHETRPKLITALETLQTTREPGPKRKHGNIPL